MNLTVSNIAIRSVSGKSSDPALPGQKNYVAFRLAGIPTPVRWLFLIFVFSLPFEATDLGIMTGMLSIPKVAGVLLIAAFLLYYGPLATKRSLPGLSPPLCWFMVYGAVFVLNGLFIDAQLSVIRLITMTQLLVFFWLATGLLKEERMTNSVLLAYTIAAAVFSAGVAFRVPGFYQEIVPGRATAIGENLNAAGTNMAVGLVILVGLVLSTVNKSYRMKLVSISLAVPIFLAMIATGSRGGIAAFVVGGAVYLLPYWKKKRAMAAISFAAIALIAVGYMVMSTPELLERWQETYYEGKLSDREKIFAATIEMISERPLLGWGATEAAGELGLRSGTREVRDTHNLFLNLLVELGIVGAIPFVIGLWLCVLRAWQARATCFGLLPLAVAGSLMTAGLSGNTLVSKIQWLLLALATASVVHTSGEALSRSAVHWARISRRATGSLSR